MHWYQTSLGKKYIMAVTGVAMLVFVIAHMIGNLTVYAGPNAINSYAEKLHLLLPLLWGYRIVMLPLVLAHICTGVILYLENRRARPTDYHCKKNVKTSFPAETMIWTGLLLGVFITYHLLHFTVRVTNPDISNLLDSLGRPNVYAMVALSFARAPIAVAYVIGMAILLLHLYHGAQSIFQSLGLNTARTLPVIEIGGRSISVILLLGFASIPVVFLFGILKF